LRLPEKMDRFGEVFFSTEEFVTETEMVRADLTESINWTQDFFTSANKRETV